jgi:hypothetical protein
MQFLKRIVTEMLFYLVFMPNVENYFDSGPELWALYFKVAQGLRTSPTKLCN